MFLIFKIQALKEELIANASEIVEFIQDYPKTNLTDRDIRNIDSWLHLLGTSIKKKDIKSIKIDLDMNDNVAIKRSVFYKFLRESFDEPYTIHNKLKNKTIQSSAFTAIIIIVWLGIIPFGKWLVCYPDILYIIFGIVMVCIKSSFCFSVIQSFAIKNNI